MVELSESYRDYHTATYGNDIAAKRVNAVRREIKRRLDENSGRKEINRNQKKS